MSVLIKGMKMPKNCFECVCKHKIFSEMRCYEFPDFEFDGTEKFPHMEDRSRYCPLVFVPPHGDLIDQEAFRKSLIDKGETMGIDEFSIDGLSADDVCYAIENAPVVIPAERSEE